ncbi:MAG: sialate O-acetylesterase [Ruminococcaceae bacterium]|nr:sialate O-acetylesterase [Oscillospiraceae bacterium]
MTNQIDILIFAGQSNMQGQTECCPTPNEAGNALAKL